MGTARDPGKAGRVAHGPPSRVRFPPARVVEVGRARCRAPRVLAVSPAPQQHGNPAPRWAVRRPHQSPASSEGRTGWGSLTRGPIHRVARSPCHPASTGDTRHAGFVAHSGYGAQWGWLVSEWRVPPNEAPVPPWAKQGARAHWGAGALAVGAGWDVVTVAGSAPRPSQRTKPGVRGWVRWWARLPPAPGGSGVGYPNIINYTGNPVVRQFSGGVDHSSEPHRRAPGIGRE